MREIDGVKSSYVSKSGIRWMAVHLMMGNREEW